MASARLKVPESVELVLSLTQKEAEILRGFTQNAFTEDEPEELSSIRYSIWNALSKAAIDDRA